MRIWVAYMLNAIRYHFSQRFSVPARKAYEWCTDYETQDHILMHEDAERQVAHISEGTIILTEIFHINSGKVEKQKLVHLYPDHLSWVSTHLSGPNKHSQFIYEIVAKGSQESRLDFTALHLEQGKELDAHGVKSLAGRLRKDDSAVWKLLAKAMEKDLE
jgi:hypothetical protein